jgi:hypothetical protein
MTGNTTSIVTKIFCIASRRQDSRIPKVSVGKVGRDNSKGNIMIGETGNRQRLTIIHV